MSDEAKVCPYRKIRVDRVGFTALANIFYDHDAFAPCLRDECAMWRTTGGGEFIGAHGTPLGECAQLVGHCGLAGKP